LQGTNHVSSVRAHLGFREGKQALLAIRILQVGVGVRGQQWLDTVRHSAEAISVGCVDPVPAALERISRVYPQLPRFTNLDEALSKVDAQGAIIASPVTMHVENALQCLEAGLAVMVEKPFASTVKEALKAVERGNILNRPVIAAQNYRFHPIERTLRHLIQHGHLGKIASIHCVARRNRPGKGTFLGSLDYAQIVDVGVHHFDSLRSILGCNPVSMVARTFNPAWSDYRHGAVTEALIEMDGGIHVQYLGTLTSQRYSFRLWIEGESGAVLTNRKWVLWRPRGKRLFWPVGLVRVPKGDDAPNPREGMISLLLSLRDAILQKREPETSARDNLWTLAMVEAGMSSDQERREVKIEEVLNRAKVPEPETACRSYGS
jgi:predicted dehydrogenase